jgi:hypothetical protein
MLCRVIIGMFSRHLRTVELPEVVHLLCHLNSDVRVVVVVNVFYEAKGKPLAQRVDSKRGAVSSLGEEERRRRSWSAIRVSVQNMFGSWSYFVQSDGFGAMEQPQKSAKGIAECGLRFGDCSTIIPPSL